MQRVSARKLAGVGVVVLAISGCVLEESESDDSLIDAEADTAPVTTARTAAAFTESMGVNVHWSYPSYYENWDVLRTKLVELGVRHVRDGAVAGTYGKSDELYESFGIRTTYITGRRSGGYPAPLDPAQIADEVEELSNRAASVAAIEGPNEYDLSHDGRETDWPGKVRTYQTALYETVKANDNLRNKAVIAPSFTSERAYNDVGNLDAVIDHANLHHYQSDRHPGTGGWGANGYGSIAWSKTYLAGRQSPSGKPIMTTECGYQTSTRGDYVSERTDAKYLPRMFAMFFKSGYARSFRYELYDQGGERFGLLRSDLTEKPSYKTFKNLLSIIGDTTPFTPGAIAYSFSGSTSNLQHLLIQKSNGDYYILFWLEVPSWDPNDNVELDPPAQSISLNVPASFTSAMVHELKPDGTLTTRPVTISRGAVSGLKAADYMKIVALTGGGAGRAIEDGEYRIVAKHSGKALDVDSGRGTANGANVQQWDYRGYDTQKWIVTSLGNGQYKITSKHSGKVLDVSGRRTDDGANIHQWEDQGGDHQKWNIVGVGDGDHEIVSVHSGKCVDVRRRSTKNGGNVLQWECRGTSNQRWRFERLRPR